MIEIEIRYSLTSAEIPFHSAAAEQLDFRFFSLSLYCYLVLHNKTYGLHYVSLLSKFIMLLVYLGVIWAYSLCLKISSNASWLLLSLNVISELMGRQHVPKPLISKAHVFHPGILKLKL